MCEKELTWTPETKCIKKKLPYFLHALEIKPHINSIIMISITITSTNNIACISVYDVCTTNIWCYF